MSKILQEYAQLKIQEREIQEKIKQLKQFAMDEVFEADGEKIETSLGVFELREGRKKWKYSSDLETKISQVTEKLKMMKRQEEITGIAELEKAPTNLVFTARKK